MFCLYTDKKITHCSRVNTPAMCKFWMCEFTGIDLKRHGCRELFNRPSMSKLNRCNSPVPGVLPVLIYTWITCYSCKFTHAKDLHIGEYRLLACKCVNLHMGRVLINGFPKPACVNLPLSDRFFLHPGDRTGGRHRRIQDF